MRPSWAWVLVLYIAVLVFYPTASLAQQGGTDKEREKYYDQRQQTEQLGARIVFVPGVLGSTIAECPDNDDSKCRTLWGTVEALRRSDIDLSIGEGKRYKTDVLERVSFKRVYRDFLEFVDQLSPYRSNLDIFHYDWRYSNSYNSKRLAAFFCGIAGQHPGAPLYVVAHSMGGLIVRDWMRTERTLPCPSTNGPPLVQKIAFVGTPHAGSPKAVLALMRGYSLFFEDLPWPFSQLAHFERKAALGALNKAGPGFASLYELFPVQASDFCTARKADLRDLPDAVVSFPENTRINIFDSRVWTRFKIMDRLRDFGLAPDHYSKAIPRFLQASEIFVCDSVAFNPQMPSIQIKYVYGRGPSENTPVSVKLTYHREGPAGIDVDAFGYGDGTVPQYSAVDYPNSRYNSHMETTADHLSVISNARVKELVRAWVVGRRTERPITVPLVRKASSKVEPYPLDIELWRGPEFDALIKRNQDAFQGQDAHAGSSILEVDFDGSTLDRLLTQALASTDPVEGKKDALNIIARYAYLIGDYDEARRAGNAVTVTGHSSERGSPADTAWRGYRLASSLAISAWSALRLGLTDEAERQFGQLASMGSRVAKVISGDGLQATGAGRQRRMFVETPDWPRRLHEEYAEAIRPKVAQSATIKVGVAGPLTGPNASFGVQVKNGAEQAAADINAKGGINGHKIELVFGDDVSDPKQGVSVANKFVGDKVQFVIGHFNSGVTMPASEVYAENGIFMITPSATNPKITERNLWNVFRTSGRDDQQAEVASKYIADKFNGKKVAILHDRTTYGQGLADETRKSLNKAGMKEALYEGVNIGEKDFSALTSKIKAVGADLVYWGGLDTQGGLLVRQMRDQGVKAPLMGGDGIASEEFAAIGGGGVEGTLMTFAPDPRKRPEAKAVVAKFEAKKLNPEAYTLYSYAALEVIAQAAAATKSLDPKKVAAEVRTGKGYKTVIGELMYDKKGDITRPDYVIYTWRKGSDGKITYVQN